jgi:protein-tyrosine phosphatase
MTSVLFLCTGNAARSVMAGVALRQLRPDLDIATAGTLSVDGMPISFRTRAALDAVGLPHPQHRSRQAVASDLARADVIIGLAPEHIHWIRREHPAVAAKSVTLIRLARDLSAAERPLLDRVHALDLANVDLGDWEEVVDPGGGEIEAFTKAAQEIVELINTLTPRLDHRETTAD